VVAGYEPAAASGQHGDVGWGATWACTRAGRRARFAPLVALAVVAGVSGGVTLAALAGARRADTAFERRLDQAHAPNIDIQFEEPQDPAVLDRIGTIDGVEGATLVSFVAAAPADGGLVPFVDTIGFALVAEVGTGAFDRMLAEGRWLSGAPDEVLLNRAMAAVAGADVGDRIELASISRETGRGFLTDDPIEADGPRVSATVVGILQGAEDVADSPEPYLVVPYSYVEQHDVFSYPALVGVRAATNRLDRVLVDLRQLVPPDTDVVPTDAFGERIADGIDVQVVGLLALVAAVGVAALAAIVQSVGRIAGATAADDEVIGALGMTRRARQLVAMARVAPAALAAAALVVVVGVFGAPLAVSGLARQAEPDRGPWFDAVATFSVVAFVVVTILATAALCVRRHRAVGAPPASVGPVHRAVASSAPLVPSIGVRRALGGTGPRWTARAGFVAVVAGVAVIVAVVGFTRSVDVLFETPAQWGANFQAVVRAETDTRSEDDTIGALQGDAEIEAAAVVEQFTVSARRPGGSEAAYPLLTVEAVKGGVDQLLFDGLPLAADDEAIVGPAVLEDLGLDVGDDLRIETPTGEHTLRIAGETAVYGIDRIDNGIAVTRAGARAIGMEDDDFAMALVRFAPGVAAGDKTQALSEQFGDAEPVPPPGSVDNLDELGSLPSVLAAAVAALGLFAGGVAVVVGTKRSRRELWTLRAVGAVRRQIAGTVFFHTLTIAAVGVVVGLPVGVAMGRTVYLAVASGIGAIARPVVPMGAIAAVGIGVVLIAALLSLPALRTARSGSPQSVDDGLPGR
jgi:ABC-type lipoprotein release transport system permease subunit